MRAELLISDRVLFPELAIQMLKALLLFGLLPSIARATGLLMPPIAVLL